MSETPGPCVRCAYDQSEDAACQLGAADEREWRNDYPLLRMMLFLYGDGGSENDRYWVCERCYTPGKATELEDKSAGSS